MAAILLNAVILGMETSAAIMEKVGTILVVLDKLCLGLFIIELSLKIWPYRLLFWRSGWNLFDLFVVGIALVPGAGPWAVLRSLRLLRILRLFTVVPAIRKVVAASGPVFSFLLSGRDRQSVVVKIDQRRNLRINPRA